MTSKIIIAIVLVAGLIGGVIWYGKDQRQSGREEQRRIDLLAPADTGKVRLEAPITHILPPETTKAQGVGKKHLDRVSNVNVGANTTLVESLRTVIEELSISREATVTTKQGEEIQVSYDPSSEIFTIITQPVEIIQPIERDITRNLPAIPVPLSDFWAGIDLLWSGAPGVIGHFGWRTVGISIGNVSEKPVWGLGFHFTL